MPKVSELNNLRDLCSWNWTTNNGVVGYTVTGKGLYSGNSVFFPAVGWGIGATINDLSVYGCYRSSTIGKSTSEEQIAESFTLVEGLASDDDKSAFIDELKGILAEPLVAKYFMTDFEEVMKKNGEVPESSVEFLDFIGLQITGEEDWRKALKNAAKKAKAVKNYGREVIAM